MTALSLADVRWRSRRDPAGGPPLVSVSFLLDARGGRTGAAVAGVAGYVASLVGRRRREYDPDVPVAIAGERRLGHGLAAACLDWYRWTALELGKALPPHVAAALADAGVAHASALRLRLFDLVNSAYAGFVPSARRREALARLAAGFGLAPADADALDTAMTLDAEGEAVLHRAGAPPTPQEVAAHYNRAVLAALLRQAQRIAFTVHAPDGSLVRRLYALCRRLGVYCDVEPAGTAPDAFHLTLAGPDAVVGPPAAAGPRLATVALRLLRQLGPEDRGAAELVLRERPYRLVLDRALLRVPGLDLAPQPPSPHGTGEHGAAGASDREWLSAGDEQPDPTGPEQPAPSYDSEVEARLARQFGALRRQGRAAGWRLVREPAPLLAGGRVLIPDFALVRGALRVFVEVAGFWTPGYLAKKRQALERLAPDVPLVLAVAGPAAAALEGLPFPLVPYRDVVPVHTLLAVVEARYGDFGARTTGAAARLAAVCAAAAGGWLPESRLAAAVGCHSPGELARVLTAAPLPPGWEHVPGAGACGPALRDSLCAALEGAWGAAGPHPRLAMPDLRALLPDTPLPESDEVLALLLERLSICTVVRESLFRLDLRPAGFHGPPAGPVSPAGDGDAPPAGTSDLPAARPPQSRPRRSRGAPAGRAQQGAPPAARLL